MPAQKRFCSNFQDDDSNEEEDDNSPEQQQQLQQHRRRKQPRRAMEEQQKEVEVEEEEEEEEQAQTQEDEGDREANKQSPDDDSDGSGTDPEDFDEIKLFAQGLLREWKGWSRQIVHGGKETSHLPKVRVLSVLVWSKLSFLAHHRIPCEIPPKMDPLITKIELNLRKILP